MIYFKNEEKTNCQLNYITDKKKDPFDINVSILVIEAINIYCS